MFLKQNRGASATLAMILGHANSSTTTPYLHPNAQRVQATAGPIVPDLVEEL